MSLLEEVFRLSGVPTHTFVTPSRYNEVKVSIRTPGRCAVLEGPSGIGKTTIISKVLEELEFDSKPAVLSARRPNDVELIRELDRLGDIGTVVVDDFHRLDDKVKAALSDFMKVLADSEDEKSKLILIGINKAGEQLIQYGTDLGLRLDVFSLEANSPEKIIELIGKGEDALNVSMMHKEVIAERAQGSFQIAQLLCHKICTLIGITQTSLDNIVVDRSIDAVIEDVMVDLGRQFKKPTVSFARGTKIRREGRAPYLHILRWLAESDEGAIDLKEAINAHPAMKGSVGQVVDKDFLFGLLNDAEKKGMFENILFYDKDTRVIGIEDPKYLFYIKNIVWRGFTRQCGFAGDYFKGKYDFALSFAGPDRPLAACLYRKLAEREIGVFYDFNEQHLILGANVEDYLAPIYRSEARYVIPLLSKEFPKRVWTKFESDQFKDRFGDGAVFPIRFSDVEEGFFSSDQVYGGLTYNPADDMEAQAEQIVQTLASRLEDDRHRSASAIADNEDPLFNESEPTQVAV